MHIRRRARKLLGYLDSSPTLVEQIERKTNESSGVITQFFDVQDDDVLGYVDDLIRECLNIRKIERGSLATREDALRALEIVEHTQRVSSPYLKTAKALRILLESQVLEAQQ